MNILYRKHLWLFSCSTLLVVSVGCKTGSTREDSITTDSTTILERSYLPTAEDSLYIQRTYDSLFSSSVVDLNEKTKDASLPPGLVVKLYEHRDFGGRSRELPYINDLCWREENICDQEHGFPSSSISSIKVPFGLNATLFSRWDCLDSYKLANIAPGEIPLFSEGLNDKTRSILIRNVSIFYTAIGGEGSGSMFEIHEHYNIPAGYTVKWQELTRTGNSVWEAKIKDGVFYIDIKPSSHSWCGVAAWFEKLKK